MGTAARRGRNSLNSLKFMLFFSAITPRYIKCTLLNLGSALAHLMMLCLTFYQRKVLINNLMEKLHFLHVLTITSDWLLPWNLAKPSACKHHIYSNNPIFPHLHTREDFSFWIRHTGMFMGFKHWAFLSSPSSVKTALQREGVHNQ